MIFNTAIKPKKVDINLKSLKGESLKDKNRNNNELGLKGVVSLFHVVDNILEYILYVLTYILSVLPYTGAGDFLNGR